MNRRITLLFSLQTATDSIIGNRPLSITIVLRGRHRIAQGSKFEKSKTDENYRGSSHRDCRAAAFAVADIRYRTSDGVRN